MKKILMMAIILTLTMSFAFAEKINVQFEANQNEITELVADYFVDMPVELLLLAVNPDSIEDGFTVNFEDKNNLLYFKPPDGFEGSTIFEYYFMDKNLQDYNVFAHVKVEPLDMVQINEDIKKSCEGLILEDIQAEYKEIYKRIIELIMMIEPSE